jgi:phosphoglycolate phosphatase-like HAD superfamily hydrolase
VRIRLAVLGMAGTTVRREDIEALPGAETTFAALRAADVRVFLATGMSRAMLDHLVDDLVAGTRAGASVVAGVLTGADDAARLCSAPHTHVLRAIDEFPAVVAAASYSSGGGGK